MTDLYSAYGGMEDLNMSSKIQDIPEQSHQQQHEYSQQEQVHEMPQPQKKAKKQQVIHHEVPAVEKFSNHSRNFQEETLHEYVPAPRTPSYSFWDRMALKRSEVIKLAIFSLVIVLGIALDRIGTHYLTKYLSDNILTDFQELMLRLSYPILIFLVLWIIKSM